MNYHSLDRNGLNVSPICIDNTDFGRPVDETGTTEFVNQTLDNNIDFFDINDVYEGYARTFGSRGVGAELLSQALGNRRR